MLKKSALTLAMLAAMAAVAAAQNHEKIEEATQIQEPQPAAEGPGGVEKAQRFRTPQVTPTLFAPESCQASTKLATEKLDFVRLTQAQASSAQLEELGSWSSGYSWRPRYCCCRIWPYNTCVYCRC